MKIKSLIFFGFIVVAFNAPGALAHTTLLGGIEGEINGAVLNLKFIMPEERSITDRALFEKYTQDNFLVKNGGEDCPLAVGELVTGNPSILSASADCEKDIVDLGITNTYFLAEGYQWTVELTKREETRSFTFDDNNQTAAFSFTPFTFWQKAGEFAKRAGDFIWIGIEHIWTGYDHLLFVLALILVTVGWKEILKIITGFTLAHSLTLILASLGVISLTAAVVEPIIALSIAYVAVENFLMYSHRRPPSYPERFPGHPERSEGSLDFSASPQNDNRGNARDDQFGAIIQRRWLIASGFGLIHGLGFAGALSEIEISGKFFLTSLISFNLGVEIGQIAVVAVLLPLLIYIGRFDWKPYLIKAASALIAFVGVLWFLLRIM